MRTPAEHYQEADRLLSEIAGEDMTLPFVRHKLLRADVHAKLAQCSEWPVDAEFYEGYAPYPEVATRQPTGDRL